MPIVRVSSEDIDIDRVLADLAGARIRIEEEIEAEAAEDGGAFTEEELASAVLVRAPVKPEQLRAVREKMGLSQSQFATKFGLGIDALQQYEQGRRVPSGAASTLLRVISAEPEAVIRALVPRRQDECMP